MPPDKAFHVLGRLSRTKAGSFVWDLFVLFDCRVWVAKLICRGRAVAALLQARAATVHRPWQIRVAGSAGA